MSRFVTEIPLVYVRNAMREAGCYWPDGKTTVEVVTNSAGVECLSIQVEAPDGQGPEFRGGDGE